MSGAARTGWDGRFPGFDVLDQVPHWDRVTADVVLARTDTPTAMKFFTESEESCARALLNLLTGQDGQEGPSRSWRWSTPGWRREKPTAGGTPTCPRTARRGGTRWPSSTRTPVSFPAPRSRTPRRPIRPSSLQAVQDLKSADWHGLPAAHVWSLWTRYACTAFYAHPFAWAEIGFPGPAYPRGYKNTGVGKLEPFEVGDAHPSEDPVREGA